MPNSTRRAKADFVLRGLSKRPIEIGNFSSWRDNSGQRCAAMELSPETLPVVVSPPVPLGRGIVLDQIRPERAKKTISGHLDFSEHNERQRTSANTRERQRRLPKTAKTAKTARGGSPNGLVMCSGRHTEVA
jgi:hypothetical protein